MICTKCFNKKNDTSLIKNSRKSSENAQRLRPIKLTRSKRKWHRFFSNIDESKNRRGFVPVQ